MKKKKPLKLGPFLYFFVIVIVIFSGLQHFVPKAPDRLKNITTAATNKNQKQVLSFVAIGDSLTEGVGDSTNAGGYVPLISNSITEKFNLNAVQTSNYGVAGNRSDQILKRIKANEDIQDSLKNADVIAITVGGNDLMKVIRSELFNDITVKTFTSPMKSYQKRMKNIYTEIRKLNATAPIYVFGIYNPFYIYFSDIVEMQDIVDNWNDATEEVVLEQDKSYFIPINKLLYKGLNGNSGISSGDNEVATSTSSSNSTGKSSSTLSSSEVNNLIYEEDHFHPNNLGYQIMANALLEEMTATQTDWLSKETD